MMGTFRYGTDARADFDDRLLVHLQYVISAKLRRGEPFTFTWTAPVPGTSGRQITCWISPRSALTFSFTGSRPAKLNPAWLEALSRCANSTSGLRVVPEPVTPMMDARADAGI
jgi:hypothetical protein